MKDRRCLPFLAPTFHSPLPRTTLYLLSVPGPRFYSHSPTITGQLQPCRLSQRFPPDTFFFSSSSPTMGPFAFPFFSGIFHIRPHPCLTTQRLAILYHSQKPTKPSADKFSNCLSAEAPWLQMRSHRRNSFSNPLPSHSAFLTLPRETQEHTCSPRVQSFYYKPVSKVIVQVKLF